MEELTIHPEEIVQGALKKVAKGSVLIFTGTILAIFFGFLRQFIVIKLLTPGDYGLFSLGMTVVGLCILLSSLGLPAGSQRYVAFYMGSGDKASVRGVITTTIKIMFISAVAFTIITIISARPLAILFKKPEMTGVILKLVPIIPLSICIEIISSFYMGFHRVEVNVFFRNIGLYLLSLISVVFALILRRELNSLLWAMVFSYSLVAFFELLYSFRGFPVSLRCKTRSAIGKEIIQFSIPLFAVSALNYIILQTDTLMLGRFSTAEMVGIYNAAFLLVQILSIFLSSAATIFMPVASGLIAGDHHIELKQLYRTTTKWLFIFTLPLFLILFLFSSDVLRLVFGGIYPRAAGALKLLCLGELVHTILGPNDTTLLAYGRSRMLMINAVFAAITNIFLNALLIPRWGINGAAASSFIALALINLLNSGYLYIRYNIHLLSWKYLKPILFLILISVVSYPFLSYLLHVSYWLLIVYYPLLLVIGLLVLILSRSLEFPDDILVKSIKRKLRHNKN
ncbi:flippase [Candidatus Solincola sp.]